MAIAGPTIKLIIKIAEILASIFISIKTDRKPSEGGDKK
jgi:hypothetical protein